VGVKSWSGLPKGRRPTWIVSIKVRPTTMRRRPAWIVSEVGTTKGWVCGVVEEDSDWLGSSTGPHTKEVWMRLATRMSDVYARVCSCRQCWASMCRGL
jgi:hypothetical protein